MTAATPGGPPPAPAEADRLAEQLRGFGPLGILSFFLIALGNFVFLPLSAIFVLMWAKRSRTPWRDIGYVRPRNWVTTAVAATALGVALKLALKILVMPLLGADPVNHAYHYLARNPAAIPATLYLLVVGAGFGEETVYRGYLFERFGRLLGEGAIAKAATVILTTLLFGAAHYREQGLAGAQQAVITGLVFGSIFASTGRIAFVMIAHAAFDLTAYWIIYHDLEAHLAHLVIR